MATPLFWKAWELSNLEYNGVLPYPYSFKMDLKREKMVLVSQNNSQLPLYTCLMLLVLEVFLYGYVTIWAAIYKSDENQFTFINIVIANVIALVVILAEVIQANLQTIALHHFNTQIDFEKRFAKSNGQNRGYVRNISLCSLIKRGNTIKLSKTNCFTKKAQIIIY